MAFHEKWLQVRSLGDSLKHFTNSVESLSLLFVHSQEFQAAVQPLDVPHNSTNFHKVRMHGER
jgi:hypothetical protein